jgi:AcrR family transcriptional regulator
VNETAKADFSVRSANGRSSKRRGRILRALHDCVIEKGYAKTTLADVARVAGMSSSHLLYYFRGKDAILEYYFEEMAGRLLDRIDSFRTERPERQIDLLAELFFAGKAMSTSEIGFMLECFGAAVHDEKLHQEKSELDRDFKKYLAALFQQSPGGSAKAGNTAEIAYSMLIGLLTVAFFDERLGLPKAHRLFRAEMLRLANPDRSD